MDNGFHVSYFKSGGKAFQKLKTSPPDAIVLDILLEGRDGRLDVPEGIKIVSTALDEWEKGISLGAKGYLVKPY
ncbi:response regulator [Bacillus sp. B4EP4a]|uniref:response regulator n=1 Tax=Bacillus sp. B4EP4a TaxID=2590665 RepID=UPI0011534EFA|nr:response regulator [Bacillus sp. B4EP4a]